MTSLCDPSSPLSRYAHALDASAVEAIIKSLPFAFAMSEICDLGFDLAAENYKIVDRDEILKYNYMSRLLYGWKNSIAFMNDMLTAMSTAIRGIRESPDGKFDIDDIVYVTDTYRALIRWSTTPDVDCQFPEAWRHRYNTPWSRSHLRPGEKAPDTYAADVLAAALGRPL